MVAPSSSRAIAAMSSMADRSKDLTTASRIIECKRFSGSINHSTRPASVMIVDSDSGHCSPLGVRLLSARARYHSVSYRHRFQGPPDTLVDSVFATAGETQYENENRDDLRYPLALDVTPSRRETAFAIDCRSEPKSLSEPQPNHQPQYRSGQPGCVA